MLCSRVGARNCDNSEQRGGDATSMNTTPRWNRVTRVSRERPSPAIFFHADSTRARPTSIADSASCKTDCSTSFNAVGRAFRSFDLGPLKRSAG